DGRRAEPRIRRARLEVRMRLPGGVGAEELGAHLVLDQEALAGELGPVVRGAEAALAVAAEDHRPALEAAGAVGLGGAFLAAEQPGLTLGDELEAAGVGAAAQPGAAVGAVGAAGLPRAQPVRAV